MSVINKIDKYLKESKKGKKIIKESSDVSADILDLLNSLDDDMLDDSQIELRDRILSANMTIETDDDYVDDGFAEDDEVVDDFDDMSDDIDDMNGIELSSELDKKEGEVYSPEGDERNTGNLARRRNGFEVTEF